MHHARSLDGLAQPDNPDSKSGAVRSLRTHGPRPPWNGASTIAPGGTGTVVMSTAIPLVSAPTVARGTAARQPFVKIS
jgi:hypothetical protein